MMAARSTETVKVAAAICFTVSLQSLMVKRETGKLGRVCSPRLFTGCFVEHG